MKKSKDANNFGFTLVELLVVVAILGLLSSVVLTAAQSARARGRDGKRIADLNQIAKALELYFDDYKAFPTPVTGGSYNINGVVLNSVNVPGLVPNYLRTLPAAPVPPDGSCSGAAARGANNFWYETNFPGGKPSLYTITFCLGIGQATGLGPGVHYLSGGSFR